MGPTKTSKTPKRIRPSIKKDRIHPADYLKYNFPTSCEDCTHFNIETDQCTLGYESKWHKKSAQQHDYILSGKIALCRFMEID